MCLTCPENVGGVPRAGCAAAEHEVPRSAQDSVPGLEDEVELEVTPHIAAEGGDRFGGYGRLVVLDGMVDAAVGEGLGAHVHEQRPEGLLTGQCFAFASALNDLELHPSWYSEQIVRDVWYTLQWCIDSNKAPS